MSILSTRAPPQLANLIFLFLVFLPIFFLPQIASAQTNYRSNKKLSSSDYMFGSHGNRKDSIFDTQRAVELNVDLGLTSDCGKVDFKSSLKASLQNVLDEKYLEGVGRDIMGAIPMLITCYFSPTWCAILKHSRISANFLADLRMQQCQFISKYTDQRANEFYAERQRCINNAMANSGGNLESAMEQCRDLKDIDLKSWAGKADNVAENRLIDSTADWAKLNDAESQRTVSLLKSLVGDVVVTRGNLRVDFGPTGSQITPRFYFNKLQQDIYKDLCVDVIGKVNSPMNSFKSVDEVVTDEDLKRLSGESDSILVDRQTIRFMALLPERKRLLVCRRLSDAMAMTLFAGDMEKSLDFLSAKVGSNPNIPENRKQEAERKRQALKDQIDLTVSLYKNRSEPLNQVLYQINEEGQKYQAELGTQGISNDSAQKSSQSSRARYFDCSDAILCQ